MPAVYVRDEPWQEEETLLVQDGETDETNETDETADEASTANIEHSEHFALLGAFCVLDSTSLAALTRTRRTLKPKDNK
ncbi:hypothetical protein ACLKA6_015399 [Drosophila palustris]